MLLIVSFILIAVLTVVDQLIKYIVVKNISIGEVISLIKIGDKQVLELTQIRTTGAAWSIMQGKTWFLVVLPIIVLIVGVAFMTVKRKTLKKIEAISISMIIAGGIGNLIDRIRLKEVVDYISFKLINFPVFNFADICVVVGEILLVGYIFFCESDKDKEKKKSEKPADSEPEKAKADE